MKLSKAIEVMEDILQCVEPGDPPEEHDAIKLGIEALKGIRKCRQYPECPFTELLPGETEE